MCFADNAGGGNDIVPRIGNTYLGHIVYTAQDGTKKHAFGDWRVKFLDKLDKTLKDIDGKEVGVSVLLTDLIYNGKVQKPPVVVKNNNETYRSACS